MHATTNNFETGKNVILRIAQHSAKRKHTRGWSVSSSRVDSHRAGGFHRTDDSLLMKIRSCTMSGMPIGKRKN